MRSYFKHKKRNYLLKRDVIYDKQLLDHALRVIKTNGECNNIHDCVTCKLYSKCSNYYWEVSSKIVGITRQDQSTKKLLKTAYTIINNYFNHKESQELLMEIVL